MTAVGASVQRPRSRIERRLAGDERIGAMRGARGEGLLPYFRAAESAVDRSVVMEGHERIMLGSANYLGLAAHPAVAKAAHDALERYGSTTTGSALLNGTTKLHVELEEELADWLKAESALVFTTGYQANLGIIAGLLSPGDTAIVDSSDHASLLDGCTLAQVKVRPFRHNRLDLLEDALSRSELRDSGDVLVIVDGVYSMLGDVAPLDELVSCAVVHEAAVLVDEAHAVGVLGPTGAGAVELFGVQADVMVRMGALSKALGGLGGFAAGSSDVIDALRVRARSFLFSTSASPPALAAALAGLRLRRSSEGEQLAEKLVANVLRLRSGLHELGFQSHDPGMGLDGTPVVTPVVPVIAGEDLRAIAWWRHLYDEGVFTSVALHPAVPPTGALLRLCPTAAHTDQDIDQALAAFSRLL